MCGLLFLKNFNIHRVEFEAYTKLLEHRGPDSSGTVLVDDVSLGHTRLSIVGTDERADQPLWDRSNRFCITYNGEIFNYRELAEKYRLICNIDSDTDVLVNLFAEFGPQIVNELDGMFAFVIYDNETKKFFVARDRFGIKPLYYWQGKSGEVIMCSEIRPLLDLVRNPEIDLSSVRQYRKMRNIKSGNTFFKNIHELKPGHYSYGSHIQEIKYWEPSFNNQESYDTEEFNDLMVSSINAVTMSDVGFHSMLSGGLDSSLISLITKPETCWIIGSNDNNEFDYADDVAALYNLNLEKIGYSDLDFSKTLISELAETKLPFSVPNEILINIISREIAQKSKVVLCGEGADEIFLGYDRIFRHHLHNRISVESMESLYSYGKDKDYEVIEEVCQNYLGGDIDDLRRFFFEFHLPGLLRRVDRNTMRHSLEARVPFLNNKLVDFANNLKASLHLDEHESKRLLKDFARSKTILATSFIERVKVGFPVKLNAKIRDDMIIRDYDSWFDYNLSAIV